MQFNKYINEQKMVLDNLPMHIKLKKMEMKQLSQKLKVWINHPIHPIMRFIAYNISKTHMKGGCILAAR